MRTLVISDLHLGLRSGRDRLREPEVRGRLVEALRDVDRLVLLGDTLELREAPMRIVLADAVPVLKELGEGLRDGGEVVIVAGNHDHQLLDPWLARRSAKVDPPLMGLESAVDWRAGEPLAAVVRAFKPAGVRVAYPGVWLSERVYATHGHHLDVATTVPTIERLSIGITARLLRRWPVNVTSAEDMEAVLTPVYAWLRVAAERGAPAHDPHTESPSHKAWRRLQSGEREGGWRRHVFKGGFPVVVAALNRAGLGPLRAEIDGPALRRASLRALEAVVSGLGVSAEYVLFGHTHRAGPLPGDDVSEWRTASGIQLVNAGCWVAEPSFTSAETAANPYRAGFAVRLVDDGAPELVNLLD